MIGTTLSHYRIIGKLGVGGMGVVYEAEDTRLPRRVALKFLPAELAGDADASRRLQREADTIAQLSHPNICTIYEIDDYDGYLSIVVSRVDEHGGDPTFLITRRTDQIELARLQADRLHPIARFATFEDATATLTDLLG